MKKRILYLDALRVFASFCVLWNHAPRSSYYLFSYRRPGSALYFLDLFLSVGCNFAVPCFLAISGALLFGKEAEITDTWRRRILRISALLLLFSVAHYSVQISQRPMEWSVRDFLFRMYEDNLNFSYWFLYLYLAFLIALPAVGPLFAWISDQQLLYGLIVAYFFKSALPMFQFLRWNGLHQINANLGGLYLTADIIIYPATGYAIHHRLTTSGCKKALPLLTLIAVAGIVASCHLTWQNYLHTWITRCETYHKLTAGISCAAVFILFRCFFESMRNEIPLARVIHSAAEYTMGVYLFHALLMNHTEFFHTLFFIPFDRAGVPEFVTGLVYCTTIWLCCAGLTALFRKIPLIGKLL